MVRRLLQNEFIDMRWLVRRACVSALGFLMNRTHLQDQLAANPADWQTRLVYADLLDEEGEPEEALLNRLLAQIYQSGLNRPSQYLDEFRTVSDRLIHEISNLSWYVEVELKRIEPFVPDGVFSRLGRVMQGIESLQRTSHYGDAESELLEQLEETMVGEGGQPQNGTE